jgi:hypothetical protein
VVAETLKRFRLPDDIVLQVTDMTRVAIDNALRQLTANGGATPHQAQGYQFPPRSAEELRGQKATEQLVPENQPVELGDPEPDRGPGTPQQIVVPKEGRGGWAF